MKRTQLCRAVGFAAALGLPALAEAQSPTTERSTKDSALGACLRAAESGQTLRREKKLVSARRALLECMKPTCPSMVILDCEGWKRELDASIPSVVIRGLDDGKVVGNATLSIDGQPVNERVGASIDLDPGPHRVRVTLDDARSAEQSFVAEEGMHYRPIEVRFEPARDAVKRGEPPATTRSYLGPIVLGGIGVASLATFAVLGLSADSRYDSLHDRCGSRCAAADVEGLRTRYVVADVFLVASAGALLGAGLWWLLTSQRAPVVNAASAR